jgi:anti-sigma factor RsiW
VRCERISDLLPGLVDGSAMATRLTRAHLGRCLRCQAELAQYRRVRRAARSLQSERWAGPADLLDAVLAGLERAGDRTADRTRRLAVYLGGAAATAAAVAGAGAIVLTRRARGAG